MNAKCILIHKDSSQSFETEFQNTYSLIPQQEYGHMSDTNNVKLFSLTHSVSNTHISSEKVQILLFLRRFIVLPYTNPSYLPSIHEVWYFMHILLCTYTLRINVCNMPYIESFCIIGTCTDMRCCINGMCGAYIPLQHCSLLWPTQPGPCVCKGGCRDGITNHLWYE